MAVNNQALNQAVQGGAAGSAAGPWGAAIGAGVGLLGGILGGNAAEKAANQAAAINEQNYQRNKALLESIGIPSIEAQEILLTNPEYAGELIAETLGDSELKNISTDPTLRRDQMNALAELRGLSKSGLSTVDRMALNEATTAASAADKARRDTIMSEMQQRGTLDSGAMLANQLSSSQAANQQANQNAMQLAKNAQQTRLGALNQLASQAASMENQDFNRQAQVANAQDIIQKFNAQVRNDAGQFNKQQQQSLANQKSANANQQEIYNKGLIQQDYNNRLNRAQSIIGMNNNQAQNQAQSALTKGQGQANMYAQIGSGLGNVANSIGQNYQNQANAELDHQRKLELAKITGKVTP